MIIFPRVFFIFILSTTWGFAQTVCRPLSVELQGNFDRIGWWCVLYVAERRRSEKCSNTTINFSGRGQHRLASILSIARNRQFLTPRVQYNLCITVRCTVELWCAAAAIVLNKYDAIAYRWFRLLPQGRISLLRLYCNVDAGLLLCHVVMWMFVLGATVVQAYVLLSLLFLVSTVRICATYVHNRSY